MRSINKYVVTLDVSMNNGRRLAMKIRKALQQLLAPTTNYLDIWLLELGNISKNI
jgi:hypothetical protein